MVDTAEQSSLEKVLPTGPRLLKYIKCCCSFLHICLVWLKSSSPQPHSGIRIDLHSPALCLTFQREVLYAYLCVMCLSRGLGCCWLLVNGYLPAMCCDRNCGSPIPEPCAYQRENHHDKHPCCQFRRNLWWSLLTSCVCVSREVKVLVIDQFNDLRVKEGGL